MAASADNLVEVNLKGFGLYGPDTLAIPQRVVSRTPSHVAIA